MSCYPVQVHKRFERAHCLHLLGRNVIKATRNKLEATRKYSTYNPWFIQNYLRSSWLLLQLPWSNWFVRRRGSNIFSTGGHCKIELFASPICSVSLWYTVSTHHRCKFMNKNYKQQKIVNICRWRPLPENIGEKTSD
jgi:hypothetical protein